MLLSLDRSGPVASAAVFGPDNSLVASVALPASGRGDAWPLVRAALAEARVAARDLTEFVVGTGPGSFSGVRSAIAIASGMAAPDKLPVRGVVSAAALLALWRRGNPDAPRARLLGDARRGHVWCFDEPDDPSTCGFSSRRPRPRSPTGARCSSSIPTGCRLSLRESPARRPPPRSPATCSQKPPRALPSSTSPAPAARPTRCICTRPS